MPQVGGCLGQRSQQQRRSIPPPELVLLQWPHILHTDAVIVTSLKTIFMPHNLSLDKAQHVQIEVKQMESQCLEGFGPNRFELKLV